MAEARFPTYTARQELGFTPSTGVRADIDVRTGAGELGQAVGKGLVELGIKYDLKQANTQFSEYKRKVGEDNIARDIEIKNEIDPDKHAAIFKKHTDFQKSFMPTNRRANQVATLWNNQQAPIQLQALTDARQFQTKDNERTEIFNAQQDVLKNPEKLAAFERQLTRVMFIDKDNPDGTSPTFSKLEAAKILADTRKGAIIGEIKNLYAAGKFDEARTVTNAAGQLTIGERESLLITIGAAERRLEKGKTAIERQAQTELYAAEDAGKILTRDDFNVAWRDPEKADQHYDEYVRGLAAEQKGEVNFVTNGDPIVIARTEAIIDLKPMAITEEQLYINATKGIGTKNITRLVDRLRKAKEGVYTPIKKYDTQFATLLNAKYFGEKDEAETSTRYLEMKRKMKEFIDSQKPSEKDADAFFAGLITKNFTGFRRGGWEEKGFKHTYKNEKGEEIISFFRFGDIRKRRAFPPKGKQIIVEEFYAGTDDDGGALWLPRR